MTLRKITEEDLQIAINRLKQMKFFPGDDAGMHAELMIEMVSICHDADRLAWLTRRAVRIFPEWPGVAELRALYSSRWKPADGVRAYSRMFFPTEGSDGYPAGDLEGSRLSLQLAPPRAPVLQIEAPALAPGLVSVDRNLDRMAKSVAIETTMIEPIPEDYATDTNEALYWMERGWGAEENEVDHYRRAMLAKVPKKKPAPPWPEGVRPITEADIAEAERAHREKVKANG